jgi:nucleoside-diphosphate-sugar epimerase
MKIIVTGALGHIGSYIIRSLPKSIKDLNLLLIDNLSTQRYPSLFNLPSSAHYKFIEADVSNFNLKEVSKGADIIIHLAAITDAAGSFNKAEIVERNNFLATSKVAEAALENNLKLIMLSSTSVYGTQSNQVNENCLLEDLNPQSPYAETKLKEEALIKEMVRKGLKATICRFGTIYGPSPGMRFHTAVNKFCWQSVIGQPLTVWETAYEQKRPYLDLYDASKAFEHIILNDLFNGEIYNVLTSNNTVRDVVDSIKKNVHQVKIEFVKNKIMNQLSYEVSQEKFIQTGFKYEGELDRGVKETIDILGGVFD